LWRFLWTWQWTIGCRNKQLISYPAELLNKGSASYSRLLNTVMRCSEINRSVWKLEFFTRMLIFSDTIMRSILIPVTFFTPGDCFHSKHSAIEYKNPKILLTFKRIQLKINIPSNGYRWLCFGDKAAGPWSEPLTSIYCSRLAELFPHWPIRLHRFVLNKLRRKILPFFFTFKFPSRKERVLQRSIYTTEMFTIHIQAVSHLRWLQAGFPPRILRCNPRSLTSYAIRCGCSGKKNCFFTFTPWQSNLYPFYVYFNRWFLPLFTLS
jgi:hypothetical protein